MIDIDFERVGPKPVDAATLILIRAAVSGIEVFCVERNKKSRFMGGALVFPGGKVDVEDAWGDGYSAPRVTAAPFANDDGHFRALAIAACRESLEEAALLPVRGGALDDAELDALRKRLQAEGATLIRSYLRERGLTLDLAALHPFARWVTPEVEPRRFDARFFVAIAPPGQSGAHDEHETMASFWATPADILQRFDRSEVVLAPPTHRTLDVLATCATTHDVLAYCASACLDPIMPKAIRFDGTTALTLPGDPAHPVQTSRVPGVSRFVLRGERWLPEPAR